jgi:hypothetical protein
MSLHKAGTTEKVLARDILEHVPRGLNNTRLIPRQTNGLNATLKGDDGAVNMYKQKITATNCMIINIAFLLFNAIDRQHPAALVISVLLCSSIFSQLASPSVQHSHPPQEVLAPLGAVSSAKL